MWKPWSHWPIAYLCLRYASLQSAETEISFVHKGKGDEKEDKMSMVKSANKRSLNAISTRQSVSVPSQVCYFVLHPAPFQCLLFISPILCSSHRAEKFVVVYCLFFRIYVWLRLLLPGIFSHTNAREKKSCWTKLRRERERVKKKWNSDAMRGFSDPHSKQQQPETIAEKFSFSLRQT